MSNYRNIHNLAYNANLYGDDPCEILTAFELMEYQLADSSRELDFQEVLDYESNNQEDIIMSEIIEQQKQTFEELNNLLDNAKSSSEIIEASKTYFRMKSEMEREYLLTVDDNETFWSKYNSLKEHYQAEWIAEQRVKRQAIHDEHLDNIKNASDLNELLAIAAEFKEDTLKGGKLDYSSKAQRDTFWEAYLAKKNEIILSLKQGA